MHSYALEFSLTFAVAFLGTLAYRFGLRYLAARERNAASESRMDRLEAELKVHKDTHAKAIANLVQEMRQEVDQVKTKASMALDKAGSRRPGRFRV